MARPPESFRGMSPGQIMLTLALEHARDIAREAAGRCVECFDSGVRRHGGTFCSCRQGAALAWQSSS